MPQTICYFRKCLSLINPLLTWEVLTISVNWDLYMDSHTNPSRQSREAVITLKGPVKTKKTASLKLAVFFTVCSLKFAV
jgi:hypothetical protein